MKEMNYEGNGIFFHHFKEKSPTAFSMHTHERYEIFWFISGNAKFWIEGVPYSLHPNDVIILNSTEAHKIELSPGEPYERVVFEINKNLFSAFDPDGLLEKPFTSRPLGQNNKLKPTDFKDDFWKKCIANILADDSPEDVVIYSNLFALLNEIRIAFNRQKSEDKEEHISKRIIDYINANITNEITPSSIADEFYISRSQLYGIFKESIGSTVWEYILTKRLYLAKELLMSGETPTEVYSKCGFRDYTSFFRAYKKKFRVSPKSDKKR